MKMTKEPNVWNSSMGRPSVDEMIASVPVADRHRDAMTMMLLLAIGTDPTDISDRIGITKMAVSGLTDEGLHQWRNNVAFRRAYEAALIKIKG